MSIWEKFKKAFGVSPVSINEANKAAVKEGGFSSVKEQSLEEIEITDEYQEILEWLKSGAPIVFVTGKAGTGKTTFIRYLRQAFDSNIVVVAPTGVAALNIEGTTINSFFRLPPRIIMEDDIKFIRDRRLITKIKVLVIDEVSMVRSDIIDAIDRFLRLNRESDEPFGGVQLLLVGDLFQLPPVLNQKEAHAIQLRGYESPYFFSAKALKDCSLATKDLTKNYRQYNKEFIDLLDKIRIGENLDQVLPVINQRIIGAKSLDETILTLSCTNDVASRINEREMTKLAGRLRTFEGVISGKFIAEREKLPSPINLALKKSAQVMFTKNDGARRWVNGTLGKVVGFENESIRVNVEGKYQNKIYDVQKVTWESYKYKYDEQKQRIVAVKVGSYTQYPLMLAWAVTIHKGQGKTLEKIRVDLGSGAFDFGQVYVALSRCRSLEEIHLVKPIKAQDVKCDPIIKRFYRALDKSVTHTEIVVCKNIECQQKLRVPKLDKKLTIICPKCNKSFIYPCASPAVKEEVVEVSSHDTVESKPVRYKQIKVIKSVSGTFSNIPERERISISKIKDSKCPFKYFKNYIEEPKEEKPFLSIELGLGQFFHNKVEKLFKTIAAQQRLIKKEDTLNTDSIVNEFEMSFLWNKKLREPYKIIRHDFDYFKDRIANITNNFNRGVVQKLIGHKVIKPEGNLEIKTNDYTIRGKYDLLTQDQNGRILLWDWKTGSTPKPDYYEDFTLQKIQLGIYAIWVRYKYKTENVKTNAVFLRDNAYSLQEVFEYHIEKKVVDYIDLEYRNLKKIINYIPIPDNLCQWCSWNSVCPRFKDIENLEAKRN